MGCATLWMWPSRGEATWRHLFWKIAALLLVCIAACATAETIPQVTISKAFEGTAAQCSALTFLVYGSSAFITLVLVNDRFQLLHLPSGRKTNASRNLPGRAVLKRPPSPPRVYEDPGNLQRQARSSSSLSSWLTCCCTTGRDDEEHAEELRHPLANQLEDEDEHHQGNSALTLPLAVDEKLVSELRRRLSDLLGPPEPTGQLEKDAVRTIDCFGGEHVCFSRFLRARRLDVNLAERMLRKTIEFRRLSRVNDIIEDPISREVWLSTRPHWPLTMPLFSRDGSLVLYFRMAHFLDFWYNGYKDTNQVMTVYLAFMERSLRLQRLARQRCGVPPTEEMRPVFEVYDLSGIGLRHAKCLLGIRKIMKVLSIGQQHYPENLRAAFLLNVPTGLESVWKLVSQVLDVRTQEKIHFKSSDGRELLQQALGVSAEEVSAMFLSIAPYERDESKRKFVAGRSRGILSDCPDLADKLIDSVQKTPQI